ncbi:hypothetical protein [uncultured Anaerococcus sp.]|uniref:hypothetical protein n=1 Tax=uncultured Anaerococcus sp. TaxID=293428 RepID=UPI002889F5F2|nr:hypothetical protein [uncultured Anaerococcus sp.]
MKKFLIICALALAITGCNKKVNLEEGVKISQAKTDVDAVEYFGQEKPLDLAYNTYSIEGLDTKNLEEQLFSIKDGEIFEISRGPVNATKSSALIGLGFNEHTYTLFRIDDGEVRDARGIRADYDIDKDQFTKTYWLDQADIKDKQSTILFVGLSKDVKDFNMKNITKEDLKKMSKEDKDLKILAFELILDKKEK